MRQKKNLYFVYKDIGNCREYYSDHYQMKNGKRLYCLMDSCLYVCSPDGEPSHMVNSDRFILNHNTEFEQEYKKRYIL